MKSTIHSEQFIIVSMSKTLPHTFSIAPQPKIHDGYSSALHEAQRLAGLHSDRKFIVVAVAAITESAPVTNPVVTTFHI